MDIVKKFRYLGSIIFEDGGSVEDIKESLKQGSV